MDPAIIECMGALHIHLDVVLFAAMLGLSATCLADPGLADSIQPLSGSGSDHSAPYASEEGVPFIDDYSSYQLTNYTNVPFSLVPIVGQLNPLGFIYTSSVSAPWFGAANGAVMQAAGGSVPGGQSTTGADVSHFLAAARETGQSGFLSGFASIGNYHHGAIAPTPELPIVVAQEIYLSSQSGEARTGLFWSPVDFGNSMVLHRVFFGGTNFTSPSLTSFLNKDGVLDRFVSLGLPIGAGVGTFYALPPNPDLPAPVNEWFTMMMIVTVDEIGVEGTSLWVKTQSSLAASPPIIDPRLANGALPTIDGRPAAWVNIYPGREDDPLTTFVKEGLGIALNARGVEAFTSGHFEQAPPIFANLWDTVQYGMSADDITDPFFVAEDYFFGSFRISGGGLPPNCKSDFDSNALVNGDDLATLLARWGTDDIEADFNGDGIVNGDDLATLLANWGPCL